MAILQSLKLHIVVKLDTFSRNEQFDILHDFFVAILQSLKLHIVVKLDTFSRNEQFDILHDFLSQL